MEYRISKFYLQHEHDRIEWFILLNGHSNYVRRLHGNLQRKGAFGDSVHEAKETILVNDHVTQPRSQGLSLILTPGVEMRDPENEVACDVGGYKEI